MTNNENNKNVFKTSLGAVSKMKKWNNHPTGSPQRDSSQEPMKQRQGTINEQLDYWKGQKRHLNNNNMPITRIEPTSPPNLDEKVKDYPNEINAFRKALINNVVFELQVLNYKYNPLSEDKKQRACSLYFRGDNNRRLIGGFLILQTLKDLYTSQRQVKEEYDYMSKALISNVFKDAVDAHWFTKKQSLVSPNLFIYYASPLLMKGALEYYHNVQKSRNEMLEKDCCSRNEQRFTK